jgi:hypothetical protein
MVSGCVDRREYNVRRLETDCLRALAIKMGRSKRNIQGVCEESENVFYGSRQNHCGREGMCEHRN